MGDVDKHFDAARRLARRQAEREWLRVAYETLAMQRSVVESLTVARESLWESDERELAQLSQLQTAAARVVIAQCEAIMRHSGMTPEELGEIATAPTDGQEAAREETLPW